MDPKQKEICIEITKKLAEYPCASCFAEPFDMPEPEPGVKSSNRSFEVISSSRDLATILKRLQNNEYQSVSDWDRDVSLIWYDAEKFNGRCSCVFLLAQALSRHFQKLKRRVIDSLEDWIKAVVSTEKKMANLMRSAPGQAKRFLPAQVIGHNPGEEAFSEEDYSALLKAVRSLSRASDKLFVRNLLVTFMPNVNIDDEYLNVDLRELPTEALALMKDRAVRRFQELNREYPT
jgi:hypothetical protein